MNLPNTLTSPLPTRPWRTGLRRHMYHPRRRRRLQWVLCITFPPGRTMATMICPRLNFNITRPLSTNFSLLPMLLMLSLSVRRATPTYRLRPPVKVGMTSCHRIRRRTLRCAREPRHSRRPTPAMPRWDCTRMHTPRPQGKRSASMRQSSPRSSNSHT